MRKGKVKVATMPYSYITNHGVVQLHDKLMIVDSKTSITGGQNIGSWYSKKNNQDNNFRDTDIMVSGDIVPDIEARFARLWNIASPTNPMDLPRFQENRREYASWLSRRPLKGLCRFVTQTPSEKEFFVFEAYRQYALHTQKRFIFHSLALNAFGSAEQENLWEAILRIPSNPNGKVYLITNGPGFYGSQMMPTWAGSLVGYYFLNSVYTSLRGTSIQAFLYPSWLHSKVYLFDNLAVGIGSFNFDETGLVWTESTLICLDDRLSKQVISMFETDLRDSYIIQTP
jgi:phosphatidylserine/phosphatidylglycerophosphate/cardiolipin synthase-like enzyme